MMHMFVAVEGPAGQMDKIDNYMNNREFKIKDSDNKFKMIAREVKLYDLSFPEREKDEVIKVLSRWSKGTKRGKKQFSFKWIVKILEKFLPIKYVEPIKDCARDNIDELHDFKIPYAYNFIIGSMDDEYSIRDIRKGLEMV